MSSVETGLRPASTRGRKRDEDRTEAILEAAGQLLMEVGFDQFRIQDVAERAGSGTGAIYRRWATKEALVADAVRAMPDPVVEETDDPVADLRNLLLHKLTMCAASPDVLPGAVIAMRNDEGIAAAFRERYTLEAYERAVARILGEDHPHIGLLAELTPALMLHRLSLGFEPLDPEALADQVVSLVTDLADR
jgi:AcrR family transcriptional regulator